MRRICRAAGVPAPLCNHPLQVAGRTYVPDFCWPEARLIVEADSWRWHGGRQANESDRERDQILIIAGWRVVRFTRDQILNHPEEVSGRLRALLAEAMAQGR
jgi:very-short-patch-repair endonuclease